MIVIDANLLLYAYDYAFPQHKRARNWLESVFSGQEPVGLPWQSIAAFIRVNTDSRLPGPRFTIEDAVELVDEWIALPHVQLLAPGPRHWPSFRKMLIEGHVCGPIATDAALAALTIECGGILYSADRDFARFPGLRWVNPLQQSS